MKPAELRRDSAARQHLAGCAESRAWTVAAERIPSSDSRGRVVATWPHACPAVGKGAETLARNIREMSGGRNYAAGELIPARRGIARHGGDRSRHLFDATEWIGPYDDIAFGLHEVARYYYYPEWQEPGPVLECLVNRSVWEQLSPPRARGQSRSVASGISRRCPGRAQSADAPCGGRARGERCDRREGSGLLPRVHAAKRAVAALGRAVLPQDAPAGRLAIIERPVCGEAMTGSRAFC